jgi:hypothetical protein
MAESQNCVIPCHCEERSDVAISFNNVVLANSEEYSSFCWKQVEIAALSSVARNDNLNHDILG